VRRHKRYADDLNTLRDEQGVNVWRTPDVMAAQLAAWDVVVDRLRRDEFFAKVIESQKSLCQERQRGHLNLNQPDYKLAYNHHFG
jgi:hypothetical protein